MYRVVHLVEEQFVDTKLKSSDAVLTCQCGSGFLKGEDVESVLKSVP